MTGNSSSRRRRRVEGADHGVSSGKIGVSGRAPFQQCQGRQADRQHAGVVEPTIEQGARRRRNLVDAEELEGLQHRDLRGADAARGTGERPHGGAHGHRDEGGERADRRPDRQEHRPQAGGVDEEVEDADRDRLEAQLVHPEQAHEDADRLMPMGIQALELPSPRSARRARKRTIGCSSQFRAGGSRGPGRRASDKRPQQRIPRRRDDDGERSRDQDDPGADAHHGVVGHLVIEDDAVEEAERAPLRAGEITGPHQPAEDAGGRRDQVERRRGQQDEEAEHRPQILAEDVLHRQLIAPVPDGVAREEQRRSEHHERRPRRGHPLGELGPFEIRVGEEPVGEVRRQHDHRPLEQAYAPDAEPGFPGGGFFGDHVFGAHQAGSSTGGRLG